MRHRKKTFIVSRTASQRKRMLRLMTISLLRFGSIQTTPPRARAVQRMIEPIITYSKSTSSDEPVSQVRSRRYIMQQLGNSGKTVIPRILELSKEYKDRSGGYTRITRLPRRREGDAAEMVKLEFV